MKLKMCSRVNWQHFVSSHVIRNAVTRKQNIDSLCIRLQSAGGVAVQLAV